MFTSTVAFVDAVATLFWLRNGSVEANPLLKIGTGAILLSAVWRTLLIYTFARLGVSHLSAARWVRRCSKVHFGVVLLVHLMVAVAWALVLVRADQR